MTCPFLALELSLFSELHLSPHSALPSPVPELRLSLLLRKPYIPPSRALLASAASPMARQFNAPPVVFPSAGNAVGPAPTATPPHFNSPSHNPAALPFISFDIGSASSDPSSFSSPVFATSGYIGVVAGGGEFDDEPPLLEELGINPRLIWRKTCSILMPFRVTPDLHEDPDLSGPFLFLMAFGLFQLLAGKLHFGIILGWVTVAALFLYVVFNMLAGRNGNLDLNRCVSLVGYSMLPISIFSAVSLFLPQGGVAVFMLGAMFVLWSTRVCTRLLVELVSGEDENRGLIAYACFLIYTLFSLLVIF